MQLIVLDCQNLVWWDDVYAIRFDLHSLDGLVYGHACETPYQVRHHAFMRGIQMLDQHKRQPAFVRHGLKKLLGRFDAARRRADSYNYHLNSLFSVFRLNRNIL
jgi:hypothetical protein